MNPSLTCSRSIAALIACAFTALAANSATAQTTATTDPVGFITLNVAGTGGVGSNKISYEGLSLTRPVEYQGSAETVGANSLTDNEATWTDNQFNGGAEKYFVELTSGAGAGTTYDIATTTAATKTITTVQNLTGAASGVTFKIRKHWTLGSVFGPNDESGLGSGSSTSADQILIWNGTGYDTFYYQTIGLGGVGWRKGGAPSVNVVNNSIYPEDGLIVKRQQSANVGVILMGAVKTGQTSIPVSVGINIFGNVYAAPQTLADSGLYTGTSSTGLNGGTSTSADQVLIWNGTGYDTYYYQTSGLGGIGWRKGGAPAVDASATPIPVGQSVVIKRQFASAFNWLIAQHPATL
jgi:uncharacterized protein (TIGR02597 family)